MAQAYRNRYKGREGEFKEAVKVRGLLPAMDEFGMCDNMAAEKYAQSLMPNEAIKLVTEAMLKTDTDLLSALAIEMVRIMVETKIENRHLKEQIAEIKIQVEQRKYATRLGLTRLGETIQRLQVEA